MANFLTVEDSLQLAAGSSVSLHSLRAVEPQDSPAGIYMVDNQKNTVLAHTKYRLYPIDFMSV
jgi:hypothetical protein